MFKYAINASIINLNYSIFTLI